MPQLKEIEVRDIRSVGQRQNMMSENSSGNVVNLRVSYEVKPVKNSSHKKHGSSLMI